jgi:hypothetical protein
LLLHADLEQAGFMFGQGRIWEAERVYRVMSIVRLHLRRKPHEQARGSEAIVWDEVAARQLLRHLTVLAAAGDRGGRECSRSLRGICAGWLAVLARTGDGVTLATDLEPLFLPVTGRRALVLACLSLVLNAMQGAAPGGSRQLCLCLRNSGPGHAIAQFADEGFDSVHHDSSDAWSVFMGLAATLRAEVSKRRTDGGGSVISLWFPTAG